MKAWKPSLAQKRVLLWLYVHEGDAFGLWANTYEFHRPGEIHETTLRTLEKEGTITPAVQRSTHSRVMYGHYDLTQEGQCIVGAIMADGLPSPEPRDAASSRVYKTGPRPRLLTGPQEHALIRTGLFVHALGMPGSVRLAGGVRWSTIQGLGRAGMLDIRDRVMVSTKVSVRNSTPDSDVPAYLMTSRGLTYFYGLTQQPAWNFRVWVAARGVVLEHVTGLDLRQAYDTVAELNATRPVDGFLRAFYERI